MRSRWTSRMAGPVKNAVQIELKHTFHSKLWSAQTTIAFDVPDNIKRDWVLTIIDEFTTRLEGLQALGNQRSWLESEVAQLEAQMFSKYGVSIKLHMLPDDTWIVGRDAAKATVVQATWFTDTGTKIFFKKEAK